MHTLRVLCDCCASRRRRKHPPRHSSYAQSERPNTSSRQTTIPHPAQKAQRDILLSSVDARQCRRCAIAVSRDATIRLAETDFSALLERSETACCGRRRKADPATSATNIYGRSCFSSVDARPCGRCASAVSRTSPATARSPSAEVPVGCRTVAAPPRNVRPTALQAWLPSRWAAAGIVGLSSTSPLRRTLRRCLRLRFRRTRAGHDLTRPQLRLWPGHRTRPWRGRDLVCRRARRGPLRPR